MRFVDDEGREWTVRDVAEVPARTLVEPGHPQALERHFMAGNSEKRLYRFVEGEVRTPGHEQLQRQLRESQLVAPARLSDPNLHKV